MSTIKIQKGVKVGFEELVQGLAQLDIPSLEKFSDEINRIIARRKVPNPSERELELIDFICSPFPAETQARYDKLYGQLQNDSLAQKEHEELLQLVEMAEEHNVQWLKALVELAHLRGTTVQKVKQQLGVENLGFKK